MNQAQIENLKRLILASPILSGQERKEWLALFELMNDKQMGELEKILSEYNGESKVPVNPKPLVPGAGDLPKILTPPVLPPKIAAPPAVQPHTPPLPHIVNLPKQWEKSGEASAEKTDETLSVRFPHISPGQGVNNWQSPVFKNPHAAAPGPAPRKKISGFLARLKRMVGSKELPAGHKEFELELPAKIPAPKEKVEFNYGALPKAPKKQPDVLIEVTVQQAEKPKTPLPVQPIRPPAPQFQQPPKPVPFVVLPPLRMPKTQTSAPVVSPPPAQALEKIPEKDDIKAVQKPKQSDIPEKTAPEFTPGLQFTSGLARPGQEAVAGIKNDIKARKAIPKSSKGISPPRSLDTLESLAQLELNDWQQSPPEDFIAKLRHLAAKFGYFEVIFHLEKSPLFKAYLNTGLKLLSSKGTFEDLENAEEDGYFSKESFEMFVDMLSKIQWVLN